MAWLDKYSDETPKAQKGKKVKPIYVDSSNDPRYRAYRDSLSLYNSTKKEFKIADKIRDKIARETAEKYGNKGKSNKYVKIDTQPFNLSRQNSRYYKDENLRLLGHPSNIKPIGYDRYAVTQIGTNNLFTTFDNHSIPTTDFAVYKKPTQPVEVKPQQIVPRQPLENINITPQGLAQTNTELTPNLNITPQARIPKYFEVTDKVNQPFGGTETNYQVYPDQDFPSMSTQTYPDGTPMNTRKVVPVYQFGGTMFKSPSMVDYEQPSDELINDDYDMERALELGYTPDETGHWPSVDYETGQWLKSKKHHTRGMELMAYELNPELHNAYNLIENEKGKMQYIPKAQVSGELNTPEAWEKSIRDVEHEIGNPNEWTMDSYNKLQNKLNEYKNWRENTKEGRAVIDHHNEPNEYVVPLPMHLRDKNTLKSIEPTSPKLPKGKNGIEGTMGGLTDKGFNYNGAWGGQFQMGGSIPGSVGFTYARTQGIPSEGKYAKKTLPSAQNGGLLDVYGDNVPKAQEGFYSGKQQKLDPTLAKDFLKKVKSREKRATEITEALKESKVKPNLKQVREMVKDNTSVKKVFDEGKFDPNVRNKTEKEIEQETINDRRARIADSMAAQKESYTTDNWRELLARETQATGDKLRISEKPNFFDDYLNPFAMIGDMASSLGQAPYQAKETDSYMPYVTSIGVPLLTGGIEGIGAKSTGQFVNNLVNPFNIVPGYKSAEKYLAPKLKKTLAKGALKTLEGAQKLETLGREAVQSFNDEVIYPFKYKKQIKEIEDLHKNLSTNLGSDEARKRMSKVLGIDVDKLELPSITTYPREGSSYSPLINNINIDLRQARQLKKNYMLDPVSIYEHEVGHWMQREANKNSPEYFNKLNRFNNSPFNLFKPIPTSEPTIIDRYAMNLYQHDPVTNLIHYNPSVNSLSHDLIYENAKYFTHNGVEPLAHLREMRQNMLNKGYIKSIYDPISEETINKFIKENPYDRVSSFTTPNSQQTKGLESIFRNLPSVIGAGAVGAGAASQMQQEPVTGMRKGGIIKDDRGQWAHPGEITEIGSNQITMQGVPYPVLGISDKGDMKLMQPGKNYKFKGKKVTEFPMAKNGINNLDAKPLQKLDDLTNFTNYNSSSDRGWLSKYE